MLLWAAFLAAGDTSPRGGGLDPANCGLIRSLFANVGSVAACEFSPDGRWLAVGGEKGLVLYRTGDWTKATSMPLAGVRSVRFSPDGRLLAVGSASDLCVYPFANGQCGAKSDTCASGGMYIAWSADGRLLAGISEKGEVLIQSIPNAGVARTWDAHGALTCVFAPDGSRLLTGGNDGAVRVWNLQGGADRGLVAGDQVVSTITISRDGRRFFTAGADEAGGIREWELPEGRPRRRLSTGESGAVAAMRLSQDERSMVAAGGTSVFFVDAARFRILGKLNHHTREVRCLALSPGARWIASGGADLQVKIWGTVPGGMAAVRPKGFLGVTVRNADDGGGAVIVQVIAGSAAERAAFRAGDVIRRVGGQAVATYEESIAAISSYFEGDELEFAVLRGGAELTLRVKLGKRPENLEK